MYNVIREKTKVEVKFTIPNEEWEKGVSTVYEQKKGKYNVLGFRKGHAPRKMIEKQYGEDVFFQDTVLFFAQKTLDQVMEDDVNLVPVSQPDVHIDSISQEGVSLCMHFEVLPEFQLCKLEDIKVNIPKVGDTEEEYKMIKDRLIRDNYTFSTVDRESRLGDNVQIDFVGFIDNKEFDGGSAKDYNLELGSGSFIPGFEDQLVGHKAGETVQVKVKFPENYYPEFAGKDAEFSVTIKAVQDIIKPEFDDKFISNATEFETVEEYNKHTNAHIYDRQVVRQENEFRHNLRAYFNKHIEMEIPESMIQSSIGRELSQLDWRCKLYQMSREEVLKLQYGIGSVQEYISIVREEATKNLKLSLVLRKLVKELGITLSDEEVAKATEGMKEENQIDEVKDKLLLDKTYARLREIVKVEEVDLKNYKSEE